MDNIFEKYKNLNIDGSVIGLNKEDNGDYFCTPVGAGIIGWDNGIHYCFIDGFGDMVFCVNPETCCDYHVYPIANNFTDFIRLILTAGGTNTLQQIIWWTKAMYNSFVNSPDEIRWKNSPQVQSVLNEISDKLDLSPLENPFDYVKNIQKDFDYGKIVFSNEYYDTIGLPRPDGTLPQENDHGVDFAAVEFVFNI